MTKQSSFPTVPTIATRPGLVTDRNWCGCSTAPMASIATSSEPSVPFLNPTGKDSPEANSLCSWLSVVLAPTAPTLRRSAMNCGDIVSSISLANGMPRSVKSRNNCRLVLSPLLMLKLLLMSGSLIKPFPTHCCSRFLHIGAHNNEEVIFVEFL